MYHRNAITVRDLGEREDDEAEQEAMAAMDVDSGDESGDESGNDSA